MSRLSEILNVQEGQEFRYTNNGFIYKIENGILKRKYEESWEDINSVLCLMIKYPENIKIIPTKPKLTKQQITAIKGRIAEGWRYVVRESDDEIVFFELEPKFDKRSGYFDSEGDYSMATLPIYDFLTRCDCFYLPDLIEEGEE